MSAVNFVPLSEAVTGAVWNSRLTLMLLCFCFIFFLKVFSVNNVNVVIRTRTEHLTDEEKARIKGTVQAIVDHVHLQTVVG